MQENPVNETAEIKQIEIVQLGKEDLEDILGLERKSFSPEMQASKDSVFDRLNKGHVMLGIKSNEKLIGKICFSLSNFSPDNREAFPKAFSDYSHQPRVEKPNAAFVYDLDVNPDYRNTEYARKLIKAAMERALVSGCKFFVADCMTQSYNGNPKENIKQIPSFKKAIDDYLNGGRFPTDEELMQDSYLAFLKRFTGGRFLWIMPNFIPQDRASGGIRIIGYVDLLEKNNSSVENRNPKSEISLSEEWSALSEAFYGQKFIAELADFFKKYNVSTILECGSGGGHILRGLGEKGFSGLGIDSDEMMTNIAKQHNLNPNVEFKKMNWLELDQLTISYDCVMCRGNSLASAISWGSSEMRCSIEECRKIIFLSLQKMFKKVKSGGLFYVDTISEQEISEHSRSLTIKAKDIELNAEIKHDFLRKLRYASGEGVIKGRKFKGGSMSYLLSPDELREMLVEIGVKSIFNPKFENEQNYNVLCGIK